MPNDVPPRILRDIALQREATRDAREVAHRAAPADTFGPDDLNDISKVTAEAVREELARAKIPTIPDSDPPARSGLAIKGWGLELSARGRTAAVVAVVLGAIALAWLALGRVPILPHAEPRPPPAHS